jgi:hypothetical protein
LGRIGKARLQFRLGFAVGLIDRTFVLFFFALGIGIGLILSVETLLLDQAAGGCPACGSTCADARTGAR